MLAKNKSIEDKMRELRDQAAWFEGEEFTLEEASKRYEAAATLARDIEKELSELENTVTVLKQSFEES